MSNEITQADQGEVLDLQDLLVDEQSDILSDYLSISMEGVEGDTIISVSTVEDCPTTYSSTISGVSLTDLHSLVDASVYLIGE